MSENQGDYKIYAVDGEKSFVVEYGEHKYAVKATIVDDTGKRVMITTDVVAASPLKALAKACPRIEATYPTAIPGQLQSLMFSDYVTLLVRRSHD